MLHSLSLLGSAGNYDLASTVWADRSSPGRRGMPWPDPHIASDGRGKAKGRPKNRPIIALAAVAAFRVHRWPPPPRESILGLFSQRSGPFLVPLIISDIGDNCQPSIFLSLLLG